MHGAIDKHRPTRTMLNARVLCSLFFVERGVYLRCCFYLAIISGYLSVFRYTVMPLYRFATFIRFSALRCPAELVSCARDFYEREYFVSCVRIVSGRRLYRAAYTSLV